LRLPASKCIRFCFLVGLGFLPIPWASPSLAQEAAAKPADKPAQAKRESVPASADSQLPAQIELLETHVRFEANGDSRKEVHARVRINSELGVHQFARLNFDFNRAFESIEIPLVHITHTSGGTADVLPSAITDQPDPAVLNAPAYQDVRIKSVRILGLQPGDTLEYRVVTTVSHHPLAPDFWLEHSFDRTGVVSTEFFQVDLPASVLPRDALIVVKNIQMKAALESRLAEVTRVWTTQPRQLIPPAEIPGEKLPNPAYGKVQLFVKPSGSNASIEKSGAGGDARVSYTWQHEARSSDSERAKDGIPEEDMPDLQMGIVTSWWALSHELYTALLLPQELPEAVTAKSRQLTEDAKTALEKAERIYDFVSRGIATIDLPLGIAGFHPRPPAEILASGYAAPEDKFFLFKALARAAGLDAEAALIAPSKKIGALVVRPGALSHLLIWIPVLDIWLDPSLEVTPFRALPASYRGSTALYLGPVEETHDVTSLVWTVVPRDLPYASFQNVNVTGSLESDGELSAKVHYAMRGDNELLLRVTFQQTPKEKWKDLAQLLSITDGFRGQVSNVAASDPYATREPFTLQYEVSQPKFVDWSKKSVRIPALLPQLGLPDPPPKPAPGAAASFVDLGTPLDVQTSVTLHLPPGVTAQPPTGTSVERDYATFRSEYSAAGQTVTASRHINFLLRELPAARSADYNTFLRVVLSDQAQLFTLVGP